MQTVSTLKTNKGFRLTSVHIFLICVVAVLYCPFFNMKLIGDGYVGDTMIQTRFGLDMIASRGPVLDLRPGTTEMYFVDDLKASDRYNIIYDNTVTSTYDKDQSYRWPVVEVES